MNNKGQVGIIVAILMITLLVSILVVIQVYYIPQWMEKREAEHMDDVTNQFAGLKYSLDLEATEQSSSPLTNSITLGSKELPYFVSSRAFGSLQVLSGETSNFGISLSGTGMVSTSYTYGGVENELDYVISIQSFDLVIDSLNLGDIYNASINDGRMNVNISISIGGFLGNTLQINLTIINGTSTVLNQTIAVGLKSGVSYLINLLDDEYKLSTDIIPYLLTPFNMSFTTSSNGNFEVKCHKYSNAAISYQSSFGTIKYSADNAYFVDQDYIYEGGAVILNQSTGNTMLHPPLLFVSNATKTFNITLIDVRGVQGKTSVAGYGTYSIRTNFSSLSIYKCRATSLTLNISTSYPEAWKNYISNEMEGSRIPDDDYSIISGNNYVRIEINTLITFILNRAVIYAQVGPGWVT